MSEELSLLLQMKRTSKLILLLVGFVTASCILQLAIVVGKVDLDEVHHYVEGQRFVSPDTLWSVFKPATNPKTPDRKIDHPVKN